MCRDHHSLNGYSIFRDPPYFLELHHHIIPSHSIWSYYLCFPVSCTQHNMRPCLKKSTLPHIAVRVFVTDVAHNRCCAGQRNSCRKFWSRKRRRKTKLMTRMIIICLKKKLESLFQGRAWCWKDWMSWILLWIYSLSYLLFIVSITFLISFWLLLFKLCYLEATDIFLHFSHWKCLLFNDKNVGNMFQHIRKFPP